ncbi:MAG TPA: ParB/RepB/Spo0J family partition protein, partial [Candidatus Angelobacter sp.]|nr:ParB/RepB/Spo0J family partition protein [Candidatus Angelobacter sp.]
MSAAQDATTQGELKWIEPHLIVPSTTNPRKLRNAQEDADLLESVRVSGVFQSLLLRPMPATAEMMARWEKHTKTKPKFNIGENIYELVAGERRWEASVKADRGMVPAVVRKLSDKEAKKFQIVENLQRDDIDAIDEGMGFKELAKEGLTAKQISEEVGKIGKSARYVQQSIKRTDVIRGLIQLYREGRISISHIDLLSPLSPEAQKEALGVGAGNAANTMLFDWNGATRSIRELKSAIQQRFHLSLDAAPFRKDDDKLVPKVGACTSCEKNTAVNSLLDPESKHPTCTDRPCYESKQAAHLAHIEAATKKAGEQFVRISQQWGVRPTKNNDFIPAGDWTEVKKGSCKSAIAGIVVVGQEVGHKKIVCADKKCKVHHGKGYAGMSEYRRINAPAKKSPAEIRREKEQKLQEKVKGASNLAVLTQIANK